MQNQHESHNIPLRDLVEYDGPQLQESSTNSTEQLNLLARTEPALVASVLSDWLEASPAMPR